MKSDEVVLKGRVIKCERGMYRVRLANGHVVLCHPSGRIRIKRIRIGLEDEVTIAMTPYDTERARIIWRER